MQRSTDRIITTHVGSLPRPSEVIALLKRRDRDEAVDPAEFESTITRAVNDVVAKRSSTGMTTRIVPTDPNTQPRLRGTIALVLQKHFGVPQHL